MADDALVGQQVGGFEVVEVLGRGANATVYRARQVRLGRDVALKVLDPMLARDDRAAGRFEREGWAAAGLDHPGIVPVHEAGEDDGVYFLAMRLVDGVTLSDALAGSPSFPYARTTEVVGAIGDALDHAHQRGVLHRDVKPANVLLDGDRVWLTDFGIAAMTEQAGRATAGAIGTAAYMAPEQARPGEAKERADLYGLGCVAYECVTGHPPFAGDGIAELLYAHAHEPVPSTGDTVLDAIFAKALAKDPDDRFASGADLALALEQAFAGGAVPIRLQRRERPPRLVLAGGLVAAFLVAGTVIALVTGGDDPPPPTTTTTTSTALASTTSTTVGEETIRAQAGVAYATAVGLVNEAQITFSRRVDLWTDATTGEEAVADAADLLAAVRDVQPVLGDIAEEYAPAAASLQAAALAVAAIQRDLLSLEGLNVDIALAAWDEQYNAHISELITASNAVRADLGLPETQG